MHWNTEYYLCMAKTTSVWKCDSETLPKHLVKYSLEQGKHVSVCAVVEMSAEIVTS